VLPAAGDVEADAAFGGRGRVDREVAARAEDVEDAAGWPWSDLDAPPSVD